MLGVMMPWLGGGGYSFGDLLQNLDQFQFFSYVLPFLLIFALVYAIIGQIKMFQDNRGASVILALAVGLLSLVGGYVPTFFATIMPRLGVGLSIILAGVLLAGFFIVDATNKEAYKWIFFGLGALVFLFVLFSSLADWQFIGTGGWSYWWDNYAGLLIFLLLMAGVIVAVSVSGNKNSGGSGH